MSDWIDVKDKLPKSSCSGVTVKRECGIIQKAYFHADKMIMIAFYGGKPAYWTDSKTCEGLRDVTHWKKED